MLRIRMMRLLLPLVLVACTREPTGYRPGLNHPANPDAVAAPEPERSKTLAIDWDERPREPVPSTGHGQHGAGRDAAQDEKAKTKAGHERGEKTSGHDKDAQAEGDYTCPMHPEIRQDDPGTCPKCGMALERAGSRTKGTP